MKNSLKILSFLFVGLWLFAACGPRPQYKTRLGKKKMKYYNSIQYDRSEGPKDFKSMKSLNKKNKKKKNH